MIQGIQSGSDARSGRGTLLNVNSTVKHEGEEAFALTSFSGTEEISRLFHFKLHLQSHRHDVRPEEIIGQPIGFSVKSDLEDEAGEARQTARFFHGYVSRFVAQPSNGGTCVYEADVVPWLWFLTRTSDCRVFSKKTVVDILDQIFKKNHSPARTVHYHLQSSAYRKWDYCVQYRESDFEFISRMLEQEGIFYYFQHTATSHALVLCDKPGDYSANRNCQQVRFNASFPFKKASVTSWSREYQFISGAYAHSDYNFKDHPSRTNQTPETLLHESRNIPQEGMPTTIDPARHEIYDYPGEYSKKTEGFFYAERRMQQAESEYDVVSGSAVNSHFGAGTKMTLTHHPQKEQNGEYALTWVSHSASSGAEGKGAGATYSNSFRAIPSKVVFRPERRTPKPVVQGVQTAVVVGPPGAEINTDEFGRVQLQFLWDRKGRRLQDAENEEEPIWVRVGQLMAGKKWGALFIPRIGQEVIVNFEEGDPDRPVVTGGVYNSEQLPPYAPKDHPTKSGIKTNSSPGGKGFNELRFEDAAGSEQIFIHAQNNMDVRVRSDSKQTVSGNRHQTIGWEKDGQKGGDQQELVYQDKHLNVKRNQIEHIEGNCQLMVGNGTADDGGQLDIVVEKKKNELINGGSDSIVKGDQRQIVDGRMSLMVGKDQHTRVAGNISTETGPAGEIHIRAGMKVVIEAGAQLSLVGPGGFVDIGVAGVTIQGATVRVNSGGAAGVGTPCLPDLPDQAVEAEPKRPAQADNADSGSRSTPFED